jgi:hypothetical protein
MTNRGIRLTSRAFNNECDATIANTNWNNVQKMELRIIKAFESINKLNQSNKIFISEDYLELKLKELRLTYEYKEKKHQEKEEQAEINRQIREEKKLQQDIINSQKEEDKYQKLLDKALKEIENANDKKQLEMQEKIAKLTEELNLAKEKNIRAKSMAEQTKSGHVYVISNIGSFGENKYKIGMTRRLDPSERVKELSGASVPFPFDVHAMIYSKDAPSLENKLHNIFTSKRINMSNLRKEFFDVNLDEIEKEVKEIEPNADFIKTYEAREYMETLAIKEKKELLVEHKFPDAI